MEKIVKPIKINRSNFTTYGDLISTNDINPMDINAGYAKRFDNLADLNTSKDEGKTIVSIFSALKRTFPMAIDMMEKHPLGSQAFIPMKETTFLAFVAPQGKFPEINKIQIDTHHFKGNYPDKCSVQAAYLNSRVSSKSIVKKSKNWKLLLNKVKLHAHKKHNFNNNLMKNKKINYIRINIYPDGGISRIRVLCRAE